VHFPGKFGFCGGKDHKEADCWYKAAKSAEAEKTAALTHQDTDA
jgi:hypothetical protein